MCILREGRRISSRAADHPETSCQGGMIYHLACFEAA
jgi:hypothetical protein